MAGGKAIRRRAKLLERANQGNLHKAAKGKASAHLPLPPAPSKEDYKEKVPASLARMMALQDAMLRPAKKQKREALPPSQKQQPTQQAAAQPTQQKQQLILDSSRQGASDVDSASARQAAGKQAGGLWQQPKKLKQRRKEYLNAKKEKKKAGRRGVNNQEVIMTDKPAFGEIVHEPPKVHLKRKHWGPAAATAAVQPSAAARRDKDERSSSRGNKQNQQQLKAHLSRASTDSVKQSSDLQELRERVIEQYRAGRGPREGKATLDSLELLVQ